MTSHDEREPGLPKPEAPPDGRPPVRFDPRSAEHARSHSRHDPKRIERALRARATGLVAVMLAGVLVAGAVVRVTAAGLAGAGPGSELPSVSLTSHASVEWDCPGPLPAGASPDRSTVIVTNPGRGPAQALVQVAGVTSATAGSGEPLGAWSAHLDLAPFSERIVALRTTGPQQSDAVSVLSTEGTVAVFESVQPAAKLIHTRHAPPLGASIAEGQSPCSVGSATASYLASGSTEGESDVLVSLFDPTATQAVAGIRVSTQFASVSPPALQGLILKPYSLQVFDVAKWVVQQPVVGVTASTTAGRVVLGALESIASDPTAVTATRGEALVIGIDQLQDQWILTPGLGTTRRAVAVRVYDPGSRAATVTISSPVAGRAPIEVTQEVPAGDVRAIELPLPPALGQAGSSSTSAVRAALSIEGAIDLRTAAGVGVVVSRFAVLTVAHHEETVAFSAITSVPAKGWVVPATASVSAQSGGVVVSNPGPGSVEVELVGLTLGGGAASIRRLATLDVAGGASATASFSIPATNARYYGLLVTASAPVVVEQDFYTLGTLHDPVPIAPVPVEGIPVIG